MTRIDRIVLAAAMIAFVPAAAAQDLRPHWFGGTYDDVTVLAFGVPDSDYVMLSFSCTTGKPVVSVHVQDEESDAEDGAFMQVRLSAGGNQVEFSESALPNEDSGGADVQADLPLDDRLRAILTATGELEIVVDGHRQSYAMQGAAEPVAAMIAACDAPRPAGALDVTVTNKAAKVLESFGWSQAGVNDFDSDAFGYDMLAPGESRKFTIPGGRDICTFDLAVTFASDDEDECCSDPLPVGTQNLCENAEVVILD